MPALNLVTNVKIADPKAFAVEFSRLSARVLKKPEQYISVVINYNETLTFDGNFEPAILLRIDSLDNLNHDANEEYSKEFFAFFKEKLGVPGNRGYITFIDPGRSFIGHEGKTFGTIFGKK